MAYDALSWWSNADAVREPIVATIDALQQRPPHLQVLGCAGALVAMCEALGHDPHAVITQLNNAKSDIDAPFSNQFAAMVEYAKGELR